MSRSNCDVAVLWGKRGFRLIDEIHNFFYLLTEMKTKPQVLWILIATKAAIVIPIKLASIPMHRKTN